jgi:AcrR family transcriptional regulator
MSETSAPARRERRDSQRNLERVLRAAHELFAERGPDVRMEEVARRAGVGVGTIYRRFPSKEQLFAAVSEAACRDARHCAARAAADSPDPIERLRAIVLVQYARGGNEAALIDLGPEGQRHSEGASLYAALHDMLAGAILSGQRAGRLRAGDPALLAAICLELLSPRTVQRLSQISGEQASAAAELVASFILSGLTQQPPACGAPDS